MVFTSVFYNNKYNFCCFPLQFNNHLINAFTVVLITFTWQSRFGRIVQKSKFLVDERRKGSITFLSMKALHFL